MKKVYLLFYQEIDEPCIIVGVFDSEEKTKEAKELYIKKNLDTWLFDEDFLHISEEILNKINY